MHVIFFLSLEVGKFANMRIRPFFHFMHTFLCTIILEYKKKISGKKSDVAYA